VNGINIHYDSETLPSSLFDEYSQSLTSDETVQQVLGSIDQLNVSLPEEYQGRSFPLVAKELHVITIENDTSAEYYFTMVFNTSNDSVSITYGETVVYNFKTKEVTSSWGFVATILDADIWPHVLFEKSGASTSDMVQIAINDTLAEEVFASSQDLFTARLIIAAEEQPERYLEIASGSVAASDLLVASWRLIFVGAYSESIHYHYDVTFLVAGKGKEIPCELWFNYNPSTKEVVVNSIYSKAISN